MAARFFRLVPRARRARRAAAALSATLLLCAAAATAQAHSLHVYAVVEGTTIQGEAYFRGHLPATNAAVSVLDPDGRSLAQTTTDEQGRFSLPITRACDHRIVVTTADGHAGEFVVAQAELPDSTGGTQPPAQDGTVPADAAGEAPTGSNAPPDAAPIAVSVQMPGVASGDSDPRRLAAIERQLIDLRREVDRYEQQTRLRDVLGGVGYILGLAGVASYVAAWRRAKGRPPGEHGADLGGSGAP